MLLPYFDQTALYERYDHNQWAESGTNDTICNVIIPGFRCPSDVKPTAGVPGNNYNVSQGMNTCHTNDVPGGLGRAQQNGMFNHQVPVSFRDVLDGTSNVLAAAEALIGNSGTDSDKLVNIHGPSGVGALTNTNITPALVDAWGTSGAGAAAATGGRWAEVNWRWHRGDGLHTTFNTLLTPNSQYPNVSAHCNGCAFDGSHMVAARSRHTGGVHGLMTDGAVRFISDNIDHQTWMWLGNRSDGNALNDF